MAINLSRNTKLYFTTYVNADTGFISDAQSGYTTSNTWEIKVLDGYSFSQATQQQIITLNEAGASPVRGQRAFNTQLDPVEFSFSTYIRPEKVSTYVDPQEKVLWNALFGSGSYDGAGVSCTTNPTRSVTTGAGAATATAVVTSVSGINVGDAVNLNGSSTTAWNQPAMVLSIPAGNTVVLELSKAPPTAAGTTSGSGTYLFTGQWGKGTSVGYASSMGSNKNQLQKFGLIFKVDNKLYAIENCALDQASIDFGLDAIATIAWSGKGTRLTPLNTLTDTYLSTQCATASTAAYYITNKLSSMTLQSNIGGDVNTGATSTAYTVALTGGNITIANNINYLVPTNLATVNQPIGYFTGQRAITGNVTAYLRTGSSFNDTGSLLSKMLSDAQTVTETKYRVQIEIGGSGNSTRLELEMPGSVLQIPTVNVADVVATTINFNAQGYSPDVVGSTTPTYDPTRTNDLTIRYYSA